MSTCVRASVLVCVCVRMVVLLVVAEVVVCMRVCERARAREAGYMCVVCV